MFENVWTTLLTLFWLVLVPAALFSLGLCLVGLLLAKRGRAHRVFGSGEGSDSKAARS